MSARGHAAARRPLSVRAARDFLLIFLAWNLVLTGPKLFLESLHALPWPLALDIAVLLLQAWAAFLLFRPSSNDWFRRAS